ncbi:ArsR family transcriptional regulator [Lentzea aerocolonigenes]|uniref:ArsR family transcriptional regulator n=1 Tax=Lentzea aerocolonigenes TaxID=68170 RepID=A0A0F0GNE3_LENAE|nr:metalloregulator ArsR/SmtB family transcription factor [Lentzea aerocolonigenes]KJK43462.1 ArsR family transcriptional regulator [Lentzea aerocolonigenes]
MAGETLPLFLRLMADPLRWRLACELAAGDRRVRELVAAVGQPQNLVSYHLRQLRDAGLVTARRSSSDGRDTYYHLDLGQCAQELAATGDALKAAAPTGKRVLFVCTGNSGRSPMAEALLRHRTGAHVMSAGSHPKPLHPSAIKALKPYGIKIDHQPTHLDDVRRNRFDLVISLCDRVREVLPTFAGRPRLAHWSIPDPARDPDPVTAFQRTAEELDGRIRLLEV